ncbi:hypothetical protein U1Q18_010341 [Sarracenia purpurea var. burkii]
MMKRGVICAVVASITGESFSRNSWVILSLSIYHRLMYLAYLILFVPVYRGLDFSDFSLTLPSCKGTISDTVLTGLELGNARMHGRCDLDYVDSLDLESGILLGFE